LLLLDGQVHPDTLVIPMGNYVIRVGNYVSANPSELGNYMSADTYRTAIDRDLAFRPPEPTRTLHSPEHPADREMELE
jgi:hypothetical protein